jgi:hypothetical protein
MDCDREREVSPVEQAAAAPSDGRSPVPPSTSASQLRRQWLDRALASAGIDARQWDPTRGVEENRNTIESVYAYYGRLYLSDPRLEWAGMANIIGPSFYAGFLDVGFLPDQMRRTVRELRGLGRRGLRKLLRRDRELEQRVIGDLGFFEEMFLTMQRKIFEDQALMHEAYRRAGLPEIHALGDTGIIDSATVKAWENIDGGLVESVHAGNRTLLYREQHDIIDRFYVDMRKRSPPAGRMFTYGLTLAGTPAVPGAKGYRDVFPYTLMAPISRRSRLGLRTPLAAGNLAFFTNRWSLIETDTLPAYVRLIAGRTNEVRTLIELPVAQRMPSFRLLRRCGRIVLAAVTDWRLGVEPAARAVTRSMDVVVDLRASPRNGGIWGDPQRRPFKVSVLLPGGRTFSTDTVLAVLLGAAVDRPPSRLSIKLPSSDLAETKRRLERFAQHWQLDESEIAAWSQRAAAATTARHAYSTRGFAAQPIDFVQLEVQVEHHLDDDGYVLDVLFSWHTHTG